MNNLEVQHICVESAVLTAKVIFSNVFIPKLILLNVIMLTLSRYPK